MEYWNAKTCLNIIEGTGEQQFRVYPSSVGCWSQLGNYPGYEGSVTIGTGCERFDTILHEVGHLLGFHHTHNRHDRDDYVRLIVNSSYPTYSQFNKVNELQNNYYGLPYDMGSIMHYEARKFITF